MIPFEILLVTLFSILAAFLISSYWKIKVFWSKIPHEPPVFLFGNFWQVLSQTKPSSIWLKELYEKFDSPYFGIHIFHKPFLVVKSPELVKSVLVKDFDVFCDRAVAKSKWDPVINYWSFFQRNPKWKTLRSKYNGTFTTGKLKGMMACLNETGLELVDFIKDGEYETRDLISRYSTEVSVRSFLGVQAHAFAETKSILHSFVADLVSSGIRNGFCQLCYFFIPSLVDLLRLTFVKVKTSDYFVKTVWEILDSRRNSSERYHDFVDTLLQILKDEELCEETGFVNDKVAGPVMAFMVGGHDTTATTISFTLYELALNEEIKGKVVKEISSVIEKHNGITYEALQDMKYLKCCVYETLRKYPVLPFLNRECNRTYTLPGTDLTLENGSGVLISLMGLHYDPEYFPEPERYVPERFEEKVNNNGIYYVPFGEGPRICIGERFGMMSVQMALIHVLSKFDVQACKRTARTLVFDTNTVFLKNKAGLWLKFEKLN